LSGVHKSTLRVSAIETYVTNRIQYKTYYKGPKAQLLYESLSNQIANIYGKLSVTRSETAITQQTL